MSVQQKTWPYGTTRRGKVVAAKFISMFKTDSMLVKDDQSEMHVLVGDKCADFTAVKGEEGTLTFMCGGPTGGYWKFVGDHHKPV